MKATYISQIDSTNWTIGKEYEAKTSPLKGYVSITDDDGGEHFIKIGSTNFLWK